MKKKIFLSLYLLSLCATVGAESVVTIGNLPLSGNYLTNSSGNRLSDGSLVLIGTFGNTSAITSALPFYEMEALAEWELFGETTTVTLQGYAGKLAGDIINDTQQANNFGGKDLYIWVFNGSTIWNSTQYAIFNAPTGNPAWVFAQGGAIRQTEINFDDPSLVALIGSIDGHRLSLAGIRPEPATYAALLAGALLAFAVVRRRQARAC